MKIERTETKKGSAFTASGQGPMRYIVVEDTTRPGALAQFAAVVAEQRLELWTIDPFAALVAEQNPDQFREKDWRKEANEFCPEQYARDEAATAIAEMNSMDALSDSEREYIAGDLG